MVNLHNFVINTCKRLLKTGVLALLLFTLSIGISAAWWNGGITKTRQSRLPQGDPITDGRALLRYALPMENEPVRKIQSSLEDISNRLRGKRWTSVISDVATASRILSISKPKLLASVPESKQSEAEAIIARLDQGIINIKEVAEAKDGEQVLEQRAELLTLVGQLEQLMVVGFPFEVPSEFSNLPQLKGRATIEMETDKGSLILVVDGYSAPITAGNFVDLVHRGFYDGLEFIRSEQSYVLQAGDPPGPEVGFIDPDSGKYRNIPLEILVQGDHEPIYSFTLEEIGRFREQPVLPFSAYGTVAMARPETENDGGSSQFFFFLFQPELTPAGINLLDGRYTVFGYVVAGKKVLEQLGKGDKIISAKVVAGLENIVEPET
ncbi:MAG: peptidylprolyl isomerase [Trichodesmium sp. MAG_R02]|jgi:peptidylprolyl isomerase|nr:peptidylprolyl isomerase [Trichodesmium sp. MAG_R02]